MEIDIVANKNVIIIEDPSTLLEKSIYILLSGIILYNLGLLNSCHSEGYKVNIFNQMPHQFWYLIIITYTITSFQLLKKPNSKFKYVGITVLLINYVLFLLVPTKLGYFSIGDIDDLSYLGEINSIIATFHTNIDNMYPATHVLYSITSLISGVEAYRLSTLLPIYFSLTFVCGIIVFSKTTLGSKFVSNNSLLFIMLFPVATIYYLRYMHFSIAPNGSFFMLLPIYLLVIYKYLFGDENSSSFAILTTILIWVLPFGHPFITLFISYIIFMLLISKNYLLSNIKRPFNLFSLLIVTNVFWVIYNSFFFHNLEVYSHIYNAVAMAGMQEFIKAQKVVSLKSILLTLIYLYGRYIIPSAFILIAALKIYTSKDKISEHNCYIKDTFTKYIILYVFFALVDITLIISPFLTHTIKRLTTLNFFILAQIPLFALSIYYLFFYKKVKYGILMTCIIFSVIFALSIFGSLSSPMIYEPNAGVTVNEVKGMQWALNFKNETVHITSPLNPQINSRYRDLLQGWEISGEIFDINIPLHFGYNENGKLAFKNLYIAIIGYDELLYSSVYVYEKNKGREGYTAEDFSRFKNDTNVQKIYDSLNIAIYKT